MKKRDNTENENCKYTNKRRVKWVRGIKGKEEKGKQRVEQYKESHTN